MSRLDDPAFGEQLKRYGEVALGIELSLADARKCLAGPVAEAHTFLVEVEACLAKVASDADYAEALRRSGARGVLDRLEDLRAVLSLR